MDKRLITSTAELKRLLEYFVKDTRGDKPWVDADDEWFQQNVVEEANGDYFYSQFAVSVSDGHDYDWNYFDSYEDSLRFFVNCIKSNEDAHWLILSPGFEYQVIHSHNPEDMDGETWEQLTRRVGMEDQILRQLFLQASDQELNNLFEERESLITDPSLKGFWSELRNSEFGREGVARVVWEDFYNNETLTFNSFEEYWNSKKNSV